MNIFKITCLARNGAEMICNIPSWLHIFESLIQITLISFFIGFSWFGGI